MGTPSGDAAHGPVKDEGTNDGTAQTTSESAGTASGRSRRINWGKWLLGSGIAAAVIGVLLAQALPPLWRHFFGHAPTPGPALTLAAATTVMSCAELHSCHGFFSHGIKLGSESVDFTVQENRNQNVAINYARIQMQQLTPLSVPSIPAISLVLIPVDHHYTVPMPDRFERFLRSVTFHEGVTTTKPFARIVLEFTPPHVAGYIFVYRVDITLGHSGGPPLNLGEVLISVPSDPPATDKCSSNNNSDFCRILRRTGHRDAVLNQLTPR